MKKTTKYIVSGVSNTKPANLPDGVSFVEDVSKTPHDDLMLVSQGGNDAVFSEIPDIGLDYRVMIRFQRYGGDTERYFSLEDARKIGEWLIEVADSHKPKLRKAEDRDGDTWFEVQPEWFIYASSREKAEELAHGEDPKTFGWSSWDDLKRYMPNIKIVAE